MSHVFLTVAVPFDSANADSVNAKLDSFGNPVKRVDGGVRDMLRDSSVHFMSINVLDADKVSDHGAFVVIETNQDGQKPAAIKDLAEKLSKPLREIFSVAGHEVSEEQLESFLTKHSHDTGWGIFSTPGLNHTGTPGMTAVRIRTEWNFARDARKLANSEDISGSPLQILTKVRDEMAKMPEHERLMTAEDVPFVKHDRNASLPIGNAIWDALKTFTWPFLLVLFAAVLAVPYWAFYAGGFSFALGMGFLTILAGMIVLLIGILVFYARLRKKENTDRVLDQVPDFETLQEVMANENNGNINHLYGISKMKPGKLRRITLRLAFWFIAQMATFVFRPGYLGNIGTIHFARWVLIPKTDKLLFLSNYGGSWESYLEDFITKAAAGLTAVWSNTEDYPRTENLFFKGATDGDRFKRWARRQQLPTRFWYSAYLNTTTDRVRGNSLIRLGLLTAKTESQAREWLLLLGSRRLPTHSLETDEIQTILFGGMAKLNKTSCMLIKLPNDEQKAKSWLKDMENHVSYGDRPPHKEATLLAVTSTGLTKLGMTADQMDAFPAAYRQGMDEPVRAKYVLKDTGKDDKPENWWWGHGEKSVDAAVIAYAEKDDLDDLVAGHKKRLSQHDCTLVHEITSKPSPNNDAPELEAFGFADGVSQPILKGTRRSIARENEIHTVEPGEFILGYPDNRNYMPATPLLPAKDDPKNILPTQKAEPESDDWPDFAGYEPELPRDFGRNGSYLVIRQLEQDKDSFHGFSKKAVGQINGRQGTPPGATEEQLREWIEAKMVGRWKNGSSLVRNPFEPGKGKPDNEFLFGEEDPSGFRCPFGAHIRRANPRDSLHPQDGEAELSISNKHRILRMGRQYDAAGAGSSDATDPGLLFMCLNGDLERQFEFVQQTWCMERMFHGLDNEVDSILGRGHEGGRLTIPAPEGPLVVTGMKDFVRTRGGGYFFMPGRSTIRYLTGP
jgi:deferrochelatase/peroxidase EfeB